MPKRYRPATPQDILYLASRIRDEDKRECSITGEHPAVSMFRALDEGDETVTFLELDGTPFGIGGSFCPTSEDGAFVWALLTPAVKHNAVALCRYSRRWLDQVLALYGRAHTWADSRNEIHIRWLKWLGFHEEGSKFGPLIHLVIDNVFTRASDGGRSRRADAHASGRAEAGREARERLSASARSSEPTAGRR